MISKSIYLCYFLKFSDWYTLFIINIIINMSRYQCGYSWPSHTTPPYRLLLSADPQGYIRISTELLYVGSSWMSWLCLSMWRGPQEYIDYEFVPISPIMSRVSGSSNFDSFLRWVVGGRTAAALWGAGSRTCLILLSASLCNFRHAFSPPI